ncbi:MAG: hypothetical protein GDA51_12885 [Ekhidna sp.]|nr:hypothetical protein [Ekhidna sp.]
MIKNSFFLPVLIAIGAFLFSCSNDDGSSPPPTGAEGFYIVNEGGFGKGNTSVSFYDRTNANVSNDLFLTANGVTLGDQAQSIAVHDGQAYIVVQNSSKIEVVKTDDFSSVATIREGVESPRYFIGVSDTKGYVSDWGADGVSGSVRVIDLTTNTVSNTIQTKSQGANRMLLVGNEVFLANSGGFGRDNKITVIDINSDKVVRQISVTDNPDGIIQDTDGNLWVVCKGHTAFDRATFEVIEEESTPASIIKMNTAGTISLRLDYTEVGFSFSASNININAAGDRIYYLYGGTSGKIYSLSITDTSLPSSPFTSDLYYGLSVDPITDNIIGCEAPDFNSSGNIDIYNSAGVLQSTHSVGIGPNGCTYL